MMLTINQFIVSITKPCTLTPAVEWLSAHNETLVSFEQTAVWWNWTSDNEHPKRQQDHNQRTQHHWRLLQPLGAEASHRKRIRLGTQRHFICFSPEACLNHIHDWGFECKNVDFKSNWSIKSQRCSLHDEEPTIQCHFRKSAWHDQGVTSFGRQRNHKHERSKQSNWSHSSICSTCRARVCTNKRQRSLPSSVVFQRGTLLSTPIIVNLQMLWEKKRSLMRIISKRIREEDIMTATLENNLSSLLHWKILPNAPTPSHRFTLMEWCLTRSEKKPLNASTSEESKIIVLQSKPNGFQQSWLCVKSEDEAPSFHWSCCSLFGPSFIHKKEKIAVCTECSDHTHALLVIFIAWDDNQHKHCGHLWQSPASSGISLEPPTNSVVFQRLNENFSQGEFSVQFWNEVHSTCNSWFWLVTLFKESNYRLNTLVCTL